MSDISLDRISIQERPLHGGAISKAYVVLLDDKVVASRLHRPSIEEARDLARAAIMPTPITMPVFDRTTNTHHRRAGRPSAAEKASRARASDQGEPYGDDA